MAWIHAKCNGRSCGLPKITSARNFMVSTTNRRGNLETTSFGWIKVNTDDITFGLLGLACYAGVFQTSRSFTKCYFCIPLEVLFYFEAELAIIIYAILYVVTFG